MGSPEAVFPMGLGAKEFVERVNAEHTLYVRVYPDRANRVDVAGNALEFTEQDIHSVRLERVERSDDPDLESGPFGLGVLEGLLVDRQVFLEILIREEILAMARQEQ